MAERLKLAGVSPTLRPIVLAAACGMLIGGCSGSGGGSSTSGGRRLQPADFAVDSGGGTTATDAAVEPAPQAPPERATFVPPDPSSPSIAATDLTGPFGASEGIVDAVATPGPPDAARAEPKPMAPPVLVDAKVGDVNGRPIYVSMIFDVGSYNVEAIGPHLAAEAERVESQQMMSDRQRAALTEKQRTSPEKWRAMARERIRATLDRFIEDELLRAEALASLTPEQRQGFFAFMERVAAKKESESRGSKAAANLELAASKGMNLDQWLRTREQEELINFQLTQRIFGRINVTWRDIKQRYERDWAKFNPPPEAVFRMVQIAASDEADASEFAVQLTKGTPFAELASGPLNRYKRETGGIEKKDIVGDRAKWAPFSNAQLNEAARSLEPGETAGPFQLGTVLAWLHLEAIVEKAKPLHVAQVEIENSLREERYNVLMRKEMARLRSRASISSVDDMTRLLLAAAEERYLTPAGGPGR